VGARSLLLPEKKARIVRPEKKKFQSSVWRVVDYDLKKNKFESSVWRDVTWFFLLSHDGENFIGN